MLYFNPLNRLNLMLALALTFGLVACGGAENTQSTQVDPVEQLPREPDRGSRDEGRVDSGAPTVETPFSRELSGLQTGYEFTHGGRGRRFHFYAPPDLDEEGAYPLVVLMHGHGGSSDQMIGLSGMKAPYRIWLDIAAREKVFLLVPEGVISPDNQLGWNDCRADTTTNPSTDDVGFIVALVGAMASTYPIDESRVYVSGTSNGAHMSFRLAIEAGERFAAIAPLLAALPQNSKCAAPDTQVALMLINGTHDMILPYEGGQMVGGRGDVLSTVDTIAFWRMLNENTATASVRNLPDINALDESVVVRSDYAGAVNLQDVTLVTMEGAGHAEPSIGEQYSVFYERIVGTQNHDVEMAELVWTFFKDKTR